jgi:hypothetical protein
MSAAAHISETRHGHILAELASLGLTLARDLHARALAAETTEEAAKLATAFHRISRGVRQSLALEAKLEREQQAHELQHAPLREKERLARVSRRHTQVFRTVERLIWNEAEDHEIAGYMVDDLRDLLDAEALDDDFLAEPLAQQVDRIRARFDLIGPEPEPATETDGDDLPRDADAGDDEAATNAFEASENSWGSRIAGLAHPAAPAASHNTS